MPAFHLARFIAGMDEWMPTVRRMRPDHSWGEVVRVLNQAGGKWLVDRLRLTVKRLSEAHVVEVGLMGKAPRRPPGDRQMRLVHAIATAASDKTMRQIAAQLEDMRERTPRGGTRWHASSVKMLFDRRKG